MSYLEPAPSNLSNSKIWRKIKILNLVPKTRYLGFFEQKCVTWAFFSKNYKKSIAVFEISTLKFVCFQFLTKKQECFNFGPEMPDLDILGLELENNRHIWNQQQPRVHLIANFSEKSKMPKFGTQKVSLGNFWAWILNQHPRICLNAKYRGKTTIPKLGTRNAWFGWFGARILKQHCYIWNQYPRICVIAKLGGKTKMHKLGTKNALFRYFWPSMPYLGILGEEY